MIDSIIVKNSTKQGYNHKKSKKVCEDYSDSFSDKDMRIIVVADGHGSNNYPRAQWGSRFAVSSALKMIKDFINDVDPSVVNPSDSSHISTRAQTDLFRQLEASILKHWHSKVNAHFNKNPLSEKELESVSEKHKEQYLKGEKIAKAYGTTLIAFAITEKYSFGLQIGDGLCVTFDDQLSANTPIPEDEKCFLNVTTSICDDDAIDEFRHCVYTDYPTAVFLGTDGIDDSYSSKEQLFEVYKSMLSLYTKYDEKKANTEIKKYLPTISKKGSGDDVSIAYAINLTKLNEFKDTFEDNDSDISKNNAKLNNESNRTEVIETIDESDNPNNSLDDNDSQEKIPFGFDEYSDWK